MRTKDLEAFQPVHNLKPYKRVQGIHQIEHFFRAAAELDVDKEDIKRYYEFVDQRVSDLLLMGQHTARSNERVAVGTRDLPITKGLQESIQAFEKMDMDIGLERILHETVPEPRWIFNRGNNQSPINAPITPTIRSPMRPNPPPLTILPAKKPATIPTSTMTKRLWFDRDIEVLPAEMVSLYRIGRTGQFR